MSWSVTFLNPWWLLLLVVLPVIVWQSARSLAALGPVRRPLAIVLRLCVLVLIAAAIADLQLVRKSDRVCTLFVLDQSQSFPGDASEHSLDIVSSALGRRSSDRDMAGLIVFGKSARIELPPAEYPRDERILGIGSLIDRRHSDLGAGIKLALGSFPPDSGKRIVLFSDGNQNRGNAIAQAVTARRNDVAIDVVPFEYRYDSEILVDKVVVPPDLNKGDTAKLKVVIRSGRDAVGTLRLNRLVDGSPQEIATSRIELHRGLNVRVLDKTIDEPDFYEFEAQFEPDPEAGDRVARNNQASAYTWIRGEGQVLIIAPTKSDQEVLADTLRKDNLSVTVRAPDAIHANLAELRQYDSVIVANVPSERLTESVQETLAANTRELGAGLIMIGGKESFGAGGYIGSPLEKALPVDMEIKSTKVQGKGALVLIMHACEIPEGNFWQKKVAKLAVKMLGRQDECGLLGWDGGRGKVEWKFKLKAVGSRTQMLRQIDRMTPGDMPDFGPAMQLAITSLAKSTASTKHVIIISDGDPQPPPNSVMARFKKAEVTCTTVAVAAHGRFEKQLMKSIADSTGGRYYEATNPKTLPQIYTKETRVVSRPLIYEQPTPWLPQIAVSTDPLVGLPTELPAIRGYVLTTPKTAPTVEVPIISPRPVDVQANPILAHWQYGLGKAVAFTSDAGERWAVGWPKSEMYAKFWSQLVRWSMRAGETENLVISTQEKDGMVTVVVNAIDKESEYIDFLDLQGKLIHPDRETHDLKLRQTGPGKYEARFPAEEAGSYFLTLGHRQPDGSTSIVSTGLNISYPPEYRDLQSNRDLLENVASVTEGRVIEPGDAEAVDFFPRAAMVNYRMQDAWPILLLVALCLFFSDVAVRRIAVDPVEIGAKGKRLWAYLRRRPPPAAATETMERLRSVKQEVGEDFRRHRRFEATPELAETESVLDQPQRPQTTPEPKRPPSASGPDEGLATQPEQREEGYTGRLLRAKRDVWKDRDQPEDK